MVSKIASSLTHSGNYTAIILAGGKGTRIRHLYPDLPKPMIPICGEPFLYWNSKELIQNGINHLIYAAGYKAEYIEKWLLEEPFQNTTIDIVKEKQPMGTAGSIFHCLSLCKDNIVIINGDSLFIGAVKSLLDGVKENVNAALIASYKDNISQYGSISVNHSNELRSFNEKTHENKNGYVNGGIYFFKKNLLEQFCQNKKLSIEYDLIPSMIKQHIVINVFFSDTNMLFDIGTEQGLCATQNYIEANNKNM